MPTYGYSCPACGHEYEKFQKMSDATRPGCPECGTPGERIISGGAGVVFKGSGFYETDYKRAKPSKDKDHTPAGDSAKKKKDAGSKKADAGSSKPDGDSS